MDPNASSGPPGLAALRRAVLVVALLNLGYFFVEFSVALVAGSVSLLADSVDFLEDTAAILHVLWNGISFQGIMAPDRLDSDEICRLTRRVLNTIATRVQTHLASRRAVI